LTIPEDPTSSHLLDVLEPGQIRLLYLHTDKRVQPHQSIQFHLEVKSLDENLLFNAISQVRGDPSITHAIYCQGKPVHITTNLHAALLRLRNSAHLRDYWYKDNLPFWIDAICINQDDPIERGHQVNMMRDIYSAAREVLVWLGDSTTESTAGMAMVQSHMEKKKQRLRDFDTPRDIYNMTEPGENGQQLLSWSQPSSEDLIGWGLPESDLLAIEHHFGGLYPPALHASETVFSQPESSNLVSESSLSSPLSQPKTTNIPRFMQGRDWAAFYKILHRPYLSECGSYKKLQSQGDARYYVATPSL
jgi:hypothetical protein